MATLNQGLRALLDTHPLVVISLLLIVEELRVPSPLPGDLLTILAEVKVAQGVSPLWLVLVVQVAQEAAMLAGSCGWSFGGL